MTGLRASAALALAAASLAFVQPAWAHGLLMQLAEEQGAVAGRVFYTSGEEAAGEWVEVVDLTDAKAAPVQMQLDGQGRFRVPGIAGHEYRVTATGDEGHAIEMTLKLLPAARGTMVPDADEAAAESEDIPAWAVIGGLMALSVIPALVLRRKTRG